MAMHLLRPFVWGVAASAAAGIVVAACGGDTPDNAALLAAYRDGRPAEVTVQGTVVALLRDSPPTRSGPHQRFQLRVDGLVVEVDHDLALAPRVPLRVGDTVVVHGQFEPDPGDPVVHYTHHATGRHQGGWIELGGRRYD